MIITSRTPLKINKTYHADDFDRATNRNEEVKDFSLKVIARRTQEDYIEYCLSDPDLKDVDSNRLLLLGYYYEIQMD